MKRMTVVPVLIIFPALLLGQIKIKGQIHGANGKAPALSHVHLAGIASFINDATQSVATSVAGTFELEIPKPGLYRLWVSGVNHEHLYVPLILEQENEVVHITATLAPYTYHEAFDEVRIIGDWNDFNFASAESMQKQDDGTFVYEAESTTDVVGYQLLGIESRGRSVNGTMSDEYAYDGAGDYRSIVQVKNGRATIVFDPAKLVRGEVEGLPTAAFDERHAHFKAIFEMTSRFDKISSKYQKAFMKHRKELKTPAGFSFDFSTVLPFFEKAMQADNPKVTRQFAAIHLANLGLFGANVNEPTYKEILDLLPPTSALWGVQPVVFHTMIHYADKDGPEAFLQAFVDQNPDRKVRAQALSQLAYMAKERDEKEKFQSYYSRLKSDYGDIRQIEFTLKMLDPNRRIASGKPVPDFAAKLLGSKEMVSNKSLSDKFYLMDFWAVWCAPCVAEMPNLHQVYNKFKGKNFEILSLSFDGGTKTVQSFREKKWAMPWLHVLVEGGFQSDLARKFEVIGIPKPILVAPGGMIVATEAELRGEQLMQTLTKFLGPPGTN